MFYKYNVIRFQIVRTALDHVIYFATDEDGDLIKVMIVVVYFFCFLICQMKETEFAVQVSFFLILFHYRYLPGYILDCL